MISDDPQLNGALQPHFARSSADLSRSARLPVLLPLPSQPQPIILDTTLRSPPDSRLMRNYHMRITPKPIVVCRSCEEFPERKEALEAAGARVEDVEADGESAVSYREALADLGTHTEHGRLSLGALLDQSFVGRSLMVEGGASVISSFLASGLVDLVVITIAPTMVGDGISMLRGGVSPSPSFRTCRAEVTSFPPFSGHSTTTPTHCSQDFWPGHCCRLQACTGLAFPPASAGSSFARNLALYREGNRIAGRWRELMDRSNEAGGA